MKKTAVAGSLAALCLLCSCAQTAQGKLRQAVYDTASAYHLLASPMPDVMADRVPGVHLTTVQKNLARQTSQTVLEALTNLEHAIQTNSTVTETAVAALQADFARFSTCWAGLRAGGAAPVGCTASTSVPSAAAASPSALPTTTTASVTTGKN
nr:hypothetical protein [Acetobacter syzygii]